MTKFLDLDAIHEDLSEVSIKLNGDFHKIVPLSVFDYIANQKTVQVMAESVDPLDDVKRQFEGAIAMVMRSFPSTKEEDLRKLSTQQLGALLTFTRKANGDLKEAPAATEGAPATEAASIGSENPPAA